MSIHSIHFYGNSQKNNPSHKNNPSDITKYASYMSHVMRKPMLWFPTWSDTNQAVQLKKMARGLKFRIQKVEGLYYLCSENKGADQLRGSNREADLRLCWFSHDAAHKDLSTAGGQ